MNWIESKWRERESRGEDGIYFPSDEVVELCGSPSAGYQADLPAPVLLLLRGAPEGWRALSEICVAESEGLMVRAGAGEGEGSGFVALEECASGRLRWLLYLNESEAFVQVELGDFTVRAFSGEGTRWFKWVIPVDTPELFKVHLV
ncbi:MAG: hypothetical protein V4710_07170 [Verrucomicrobiota bacterium]